MSYSRWSNGEWYIFWISFNGETLEDQYLAMWHIAAEHPEVPYPEVKEAYEAQDLKRFFSNLVTNEDIEELAGYVDEWLIDMEQEFGESSES